MDRTNRRIMRKEAMQATIGRINIAISDVNFSDPNGEATFHELLRKRDYLAQQIAEASYTMYSMKADQREVQSIISDVDVFHCPEWVKYDIEQLAASRRRWSIRASKQIWLD